MCVQHFFLHRYFFNARRSTTLILVFFLLGCLLRGASNPPDCDCGVLKSNFCLRGGWSIRKNLSRFPNRGELRSMTRLWPSPAPSSFVNIFNNVLTSGQTSLVQLIKWNPFFGYGYIMSLTAIAFSNFFADSFKARESKCDLRAVCRDPRVIRRERLWVRNFP